MDSSLAQSSIQQKDLSHQSWFHQMMVKKWSFRNRIISIKIWNAHRATPRNTSAVKEESGFSIGSLRLKKPQKRVHSNFYSHSSSSNLRELKVNTRSILTMQTRIKQDRSKVIPSPAFWPLNNKRTRFLSKSPCNKRWVMVDFLCKKPCSLEDKFHKLWHQCRTTKFSWNRSHKLKKAKKWPRWMTKKQSKVGVWLIDKIKMSWVLRNMLQDSSFGTWNSLSV